MNISKVEVSTNKAPAPAGPYSQALIVGELVFVAGQRPTHPVTGDLAEDLKGQVSQCISNVEQILLECGSSLGNIVRSNVYLSDLKYFAEMNEVYSAMIPKPYPVRTTVGTELRGIKVEIEVIAIRNSGTA